MNKLLVAAIAVATFGAGSAFAAELCKVPKQEWQPREALQQKLEAEGWKISRIKTDEGCFEVYGTDGNGKRMETYFNPKTFEVVASK